MPLDALPEPRRATLKGAPLEQVIWQVRHEESAKASDVTQVLKVRDLLEHQYPVIERAEVSEIVLNGAAMAAGVAGWRLATDDGSWSLLISPSFFVLECARYTTWTEFRSRADGLLQAIGAVFNPALMQRIGLRYVDRLSREASSMPAQWNEQLHPAVLGFASNDAIGDNVVVVQTTNHMKFGNHFAIVRTSCAPDTSTDSGYSMVLDTDCSDAKARAFAIDDIARTTEDLHELNLRLFQLTLSSSYLDELTEGGSA